MIMFRGWGNVICLILLFWFDLFGRNEWFKGESPFGRRTSST